MLSQNGLAKADLLVMHNSRLTPAAATLGPACRNRLNALCIKGASGSYGGIEVTPAGQEGPNHDRRPQARLLPLRSLARRSRCVLWGKPQIRHSNPTRAGA